MQRRLYLLLTIVAAAATITARAVAQETPPCATPSADPDWTVATPAAAGFDRSALRSLLQAVGTGKQNIHAVLVERHGQLLAELYRVGRDRPIDVLYGIGNPFASDVRFSA